MTPSPPAGRPCATIARPAASSAISSTISKSMIAKENLAPAAIAPPASSASCNPAVPPSIVRSASVRYQERMVRVLPSFLVVAALVAGSAMPAGAVSTFLAEVDDLPMAPGLVEQPGGTLFDTPEGRIVEAVAEGETDVDKVV